MSLAIPLVEIPGQSIDGVNFKAVATGTGTVVTTTATQTLTNKTLTAPTITAPVITGAMTVADGATLTTPIITVDVQSLAGAGTTVADAAAINATAPGFIHATAGNNSVGVLLPTAAAGKVFFIKNADAANDIMKVYAQVNSTINAIAANSPIAMAAKTSATFVALNSTAWYTIPLLPS